MSMATSNANAKPRKNGVEEPLPEHRQKIVEAANAAYQQILAERDELESRLREATLEIEGMKVQLGSLKSVVNMMESSYSSVKLEADNRVLHYQQERDFSVKAAASMEAVLINIHAILNNALAPAKEPEPEE